MNSTLASEGDRILAAWAVGELDEGTALKHMKRLRALGSGAQ